MIRNLVFSGGGVLGISYLGVLKHLEEINILKGIKRVAGTSAGAITALVVSFRLPHPEVKRIADSLDYRKIIHSDRDDILEIRNIKEKLDSVFENASSFYRLFKNYGWHSTYYIYQWIQTIIQEQFDPTLKKPPYTFRDFKNNSIHKNKRDFLDLYVLGTHLNQCKTVVFSYETTPDMEVALAVKISMSIPFLFEPTVINQQILVDGGVLCNYAIDLFDIGGYNPETLGIKCNHMTKERTINHILDFARMISQCYLRKEDERMKHDFNDMRRTIEINIYSISSLHFQIYKNDPDYLFLYNQGYQASNNFFSKSERK